jgi:hypothetical protein
VASRCQKVQHDRLGVLQLEELTAVLVGDLLDPEDGTHAGRVGVLGDERDVLDPARLAADEGGRGDPSARWSR